MEHQGGNLRRPHGDSIRDGLYSATLQFRQAQVNSHRNCIPVLQSDFSGCAHDLHTAHITTPLGRFHLGGPVSCHLQFQMPLAVSNVSNSLFVLHGQNSSLKLIFGQLDDTKSMDVGVALAPQVGRIISRKEGGGSAEGAGGVLSLLPVSRVSAGFSFPALPPSLPKPCQSGHKALWMPSYPRRRFLWKGPAAPLQQCRLLWRGSHTRELCRTPCRLQWKGCHTA